MCVLPSVYEQDCVMAWQCVSIAILITVTPRTLPSLHVLYWTDRNRSRVTRRFVPACVTIVDTEKCWNKKIPRASSQHKWGPKWRQQKTAVPRTTTSPTDFFSPSLIYRLCLLEVSTRPRLSSTSMFQIFSGVRVKLVSAAQSISNF